MEKWKIATLAALFLALMGFGIAQQNSDKKAAMQGATPAETPVSSIYIGKTPPDWNFKNWNSAPISLASLRGKIALVEIFRTQCPHCQEATPFMVALQKRYGPRGLKIVAIQSPGQYSDATNPENDWAKVQTWLKENKVTYPVAFDQGSKYFQGTLLKQILKGDTKKVLYPTMWLLDPTGKITWAQTGHDTGKAISLAVELERRFPTTNLNSEAARTNGADLAKWLKSHLTELEADETQSKAFGDDLGLRLLKPE